MLKEKLRNSKKDGTFKKKNDIEFARLKDRYQNDEGHTYLLEVDSYAWIRATRFVLENGHPGNLKAGKTSYDTFMLAPVGAVLKILPVKGR